MRRLSLLCTILAAILVVALVNCGGGGGAPPVRTADTQFVVNAYATYATRYDPLNNEQVHGKFAATPPVSATVYDWAVITDNNGNGIVTSTNCTVCPSVAPPVTMQVWLAADYKCSLPPPAVPAPVTTSGAWKVRGGQVEVACQGNPAAAASPDPITVSSLPSSITLTGQNLSTSYGTPKVQWYDDYGYMVVDQYASSYSSDGTSLTVATPSSASTLFGGMYGIVVMPKQSDGTYWSQAGAAIEVDGNPPLTPLTVSGTDQSQWACGDEGGCMTLYDYGDFNLTMNGHLVSASYSQSTLPEDLVSSLADSLNNSGYFYARPMGATLYVAAKNGASISYSYGCASGWPNPPQSPWSSVYFSGCGFWM